MNEGTPVVRRPPQLQGVAHLAIACVTGVVFAFVSIPAGVAAALAVALILWRIDYVAVLLAFCSLLAILLAMRLVAGESAVLETIATYAYWTLASGITIGLVQHAFPRFAPPKVEDGGEIPFVTRAEHSAPRPRAKHAPQRRRVSAWRVAVVFFPLVAFTAGYVLANREARQARTALPISLAAFEPPEPWIGGTFVENPHHSGAGALSLKTRDGNRAGASQRTVIELSAVDSSSLALQLWIYVTHIDAFDNRVWASRLELCSDSECRNSYVAWLDRTTRSGWNEVIIPFEDFGTNGDPDLGRIVKISVSVYSHRNMQVRVVLDDLAIVPLGR